MPRFRKKPVEIEAIQWKGGDTDILDNFCGMNWGRANAHEIPWGLPDDGEAVVVWNTKERQWLCLPVDAWLIRGIHGELYPCAPDVFVATYEAA